VSLLEPDKWNITASKMYLDAAKANPTDAAPFSNISAVHYEMGHYEMSIQFAMKALSLSKDQTDETKKQRLGTRMAKSYINLLHLNEECPALVSDGERREYQACLEALGDVWEKYPDGSKLRRQILDRIPRYRPRL
jgi:hypothetical protein